MKKLLITSAVATLCATVAFADGHNNSGNASEGAKGKGLDVADQTSSLKGGSNIAQDVPNGWGQVGGVAKGPKSDDD